MHNRARRYRCRSGEAMFVPGFTGTIKCPDPLSFCAGEDISGVLYGESSLAAQWGALSASFALASTLLFLVCCCGKVRRPASKRLMECCGVQLKHGELVR